MNRRVFLSNVVAVGAVAGLRPGAALASTGPASAAGADAAAATVGAQPAAVQAAGRALSRQFFAGALQARFAVAGAATHLDLVALDEARPARGLDQFSAIFRDVNATGRVLPAGMYALSHPRHGDVQLYLEPATDSPRGVCYRAALCLFS